MNKVNVKRIDTRIENVQRRFAEPFEGIRVKFNSLISTSIEHIMFANSKW